MVRRPSKELVIVGGRSGAEVRLREFARVVDLFEHPEERIEYQGRRAGKLQRVARAGIAGLELPAKDVIEITQAR